MSSLSSRSRALVIAGVLAMLTTGCAGGERPDVERVATEFEDPVGDAEARCDLLVPMARERLEDEAGAPCSEAIGNLRLEGGEVERVEVWGTDAQVRLSGDTLFLSRTPTGWRVAAALCSPRPGGPYDCEVEG